jgi:hypothetical protein
MDTEPEKSKSLEYTLGILILLGSVAAIFIWYEVRMRQRSVGHRYAQSVNNARQIGLALMEFDIEYGSYPNKTTVPLVTKSHPAHGYDLSGTTSNAIFRQLFAVGFTQSEQMFYANIPGTIRPDGDIAPGEALKKGEVGFSYISGLSSKDDPLTPLVIAPLVPGTTKFDPEPFKGEIIILHIDNSVRTYPISVDGHVYDKGINLLSAKHPIWKGKAPDIRYPE